MRRLEMDAFDIAAKILGIISPISSIIAVIITKKKSPKESGFNITQKNSKIDFHPTLTVNKSYTSNYTNSKHGATQVKTEISPHSESNSTAFEGFLLAAILFMFIAFIALKKVKQIMITLFLLLSVASVIVSLIGIRKRHEMLEEKPVASHLLLCVAGTVLPILSNYQLYQPLPFDVFYAKIFPSNIGGLANIITYMFIEAIKIRRPTYYFLLIFAGLIMIAMYELVMLTSSIKLCRTKKTPQHKFVFETIVFIMCALTVTGLTYQIVSSIVAQIGSLMAWISSPSFHLS